MTQKAWSFKAIEQENLRYYGNNGYNDDSSSYYRYDSLVANHKNVKEGDIVIITNRHSILGVSVIEKIHSYNTNKKRNKCHCTDCDAKKITQRKNKKPEWRCSHGHEFDFPRVIKQPIVEFIANYQSNYRLIEGISIDELILETPRYNVQLSIQEINLDWAKRILDSHYKTPSLKADEANEENEENEENHIFDDNDRRITIERQIKQRRGQKKFRDALLKPNPECAVTGCVLIDILEAAHIDAYRNDSHNHISNGLILRSDIHTLFDLNLLAINPETQELFLSEKAIIAGYAEFNRKKIKTNHNLSYSALSKRWSLFNKQQTK